MATSNWEADKMLDVYIYDYLLKRNLSASAKAFQTEGKVSSDPVAIDAPGGFLFEWWSVFWDIFIARTNEKHSEVAASYIETQQLKAREAQQQQQQQHHAQQQQQHAQQQQQHAQQQHQQKQQLLLQLQQQQHMRRENMGLPNGSTNGLTGNDLLLQQRINGNHQPASEVAARIWTETMRDNPSSVRPGALLDDAAQLKGAGSSGNPRGQYDNQPLHAGLTRQILVNQGGNVAALQHARSQQLFSTTSIGQDNKNNVNLLLGTGRGGSEAALLQMGNRLSPGGNQATSPQQQLHMKNWASIPGIEQLRPAITSLNPHPNNMHGYNQLLRVTPQQLLLLQSQPGGSGGLSAQNNALQNNAMLLNELDTRRMKQMLANGRTSSGGKDGSVAGGESSLSQGGSPRNVGSPGLPRSNVSDQELLFKQIQAQRALTNNQAQLQVQQQHAQQQAMQASQQQAGQQSGQVQAGSGSQGVANGPIGPQNSQGQAGTQGAVPEGVVGNSNGFERSDSYGGLESSPSTTSASAGKVPGKVSNGRKRKQPGTSSGPANSTGTNNTAGPSPASAPSTPSAHTPPEDVISLAGFTGLHHSSSTSNKPSMMFATEGPGSMTSPGNQLADLERFGEDGSLDDNVESFLSAEQDDTRDVLFSKRAANSHNLDAGKEQVSAGFTFNEVGCLRASTDKVVCCHFSFDGKVLASAGHDKKALLWNMDNFTLRSTLEEHTLKITDIRFGPSSSRLATSSFDKTVRVWDAETPSYSLRTFQGHGAQVMSLDFHPNNEDLLCSCDGDSEIRYWNINQGVCRSSFKVAQGAITKVRFQPKAGRLLAAAAENVVSIFDIDSETCVLSLQSHTKPVHDLCWDATGDYVASVSEDSVRVWSLGQGGEGGECVHELISSGNKFHSCVFHPNYPPLLVIGCYQSLELWNMAENKSMTVPAHAGLIADLAQSPVTGMVASASHDKVVKLWK
eukprot:TRINITY_DN1898_c0_g1_i1.p1 TRINITY_DN1898_c0_g1~~TRINITY_DN1898_c0_g1_i1.p1  ORF type:complete len:962 (+),score=206.18 TRINITY_DN1898_c0_g1_i1:183-3068(+)